MNANQKGTALVGGAITDEVMESSSSILAPGMYGAGQKGLQQFYSPPEASSLALKVIGDHIAVLDPTAGDGSLLREFNPTRSFGIEIDADQVKASEGSYNALKGDFQHFYTLLRLGMSPWNAIVANPPFGLQWSDPTLRDGKPTNSTVLTLMMVNRLLSENGQFMFICAQNRYEKQITQIADHSTVYAVIECEDLFEGTREPSVILFGLHDAIRSAATPGVLGNRKVSLDMLDLCGDWVLELREKALDDYSSVARSEYATYQRTEELPKLQGEYDRRIEKRIKTREFDAQLYNGDHIQWYPSAFANLALRQAGLLGDFNGLNGQPVAYFAQNERLWFKLGSAEERGLVTIDPKLRQAVANVLGDIQKHRIPLYAVKPQQRLGFLDDIDTLICKKDDPERRFKKGEVYRIDSTTKTIVEKEERLVESKKNPGEYTPKTFEKHRKVMSITLSGQGAHYTVQDGGDNATQDISWLISHFEIPDPGQIATRHPEQIAALEQLVRDVMDEFAENSKEWEETHSVSKPFSTRDFQVSDIARLVFKEFGVCAWEQGLGKTVGALAFYRAATQLRASKKLLITCPGDLIPQWIRECERFLGVTPTVIQTHGQAKKIAKHLRTGGEGIYIVHYEGMAINGTLRKNIQLPVITVKEWDERQLVKGTDKRGYWYWHRETDDQKIGRSVTGDVLESLGFDKFHAEIAGQGSPTEELIDYMAEKGWVQKFTRGYYLEAPNLSDYAQYGYIRPRWEQVTKKLTSKDICPECHSDTRNGWGGLFCDAELEDGSKCGYAHFSVRMKPIASLLSTAFHDGVVVLDEITYIQGRDSKRSKAMRGVQGRYRLGLSGTPIKNYVHQIFWPLAWCLGYSKPWFPYDYTGGMTRFENDFCVIEYSVNGKRKETRAVLPDVTNLSRFWRMLASHNIRRRQEETGEDLVDIFYHEVKVPLGLAQAEQTKEWLKGRDDGKSGFPAFFAEKYPDAKVVKAGLHTIMAGLLGLNWKLDYAATLPKADPDHEWTGIEVENWTPANLRTLELTMALVQSGRKVLVGSHIVDEGKWLAERLVEKGVAALHIVDDSGTTVGKEKRAKIVYDFQTDDDIQVFCAGMKAIRLGHNLDTANAVVINGLDFDYETLDQFVKRVRRLTSTKDVDVYVILPTLEDQHTITSRKWQLLNLKGNAADLALDGRLVLKNEQEISEKEMIEELQKRGLTITDEAVEEADILEAWEVTPQIDEFEGAALIPPRPEKLEVPEPEEGDQLSLDTPIPDTVPDELIVEQIAAEMPPEVDPIDAAEELLAAEFTYGGVAEQVPDVTSSSDPSPIPVFGGMAQIASDEELAAAEAFAAFVSTTDAETVEDAPLALGAEESVSVPIEEPEPIVEDMAVADVSPAPSLDYMGQLRQAKELLDLNVLTQDEFDTLKAELLAGLRAAA